MNVISLERPALDEMAVGAALCAKLHILGEHLAAGFLELPQGTVLQRMARAVRRQLERAEPPTWRGEALYPAGAFSWYKQDNLISFSYSHSLVVPTAQLEQRIAESDGDARETYLALRDLLGGYYQVGSGIDRDIALGGANYTHSILNYGRIVREGLVAYERRIEEGLERARHAEDAEKIAFYAAMRDVIEGLRSAHRRALATLLAAEPSEEDYHKTWARLVEALKRVPWQPVRDFYEGLVGVNFMYYIDGCDNLGRFDQDLGTLYEADLDTGRLTHEQGVTLVRQMWKNMDANSGWNVAIGGSNPDGTSAANRLTLACIQAARGQRRPNLALRLRRDAPPEILDAALDTIASGCGLPALYNEELYLRAIAEAHLNVAAEDVAHYAFGGCTELMIHGRSNVGSLDAGLNLPLILTETLRKHLVGCSSFEQLWQHVADDIAATVARMARQVSQAQKWHARYQPQPIRTLFVDDCLDAGIEFNAGGARYNWSVVNVGGLANVADSLAAVREVVFEKQEVDAATLWAALEANYVGYEALRQRLARCPRYGNDDPAADEIARRIARTVFEEMRRYAPWRGGRFVPGCLMFVTYAAAGVPTMATPDGRLAGEPIADSIGAMQGRDRHGPTALIRSVASIPQYLAPGTLVTNLRLARAMFDGDNRAKLKDLIRTYFRLGGLQMQITVVHQETLHNALRHPERYSDLIVRVGGYSEYWSNLSPELRQTILERTEHTA